jgi:hypothetical protein
MQSDFALPDPATVAVGTYVAALPQRILNIVLFVTVLTSSIAFIEPSPHDGLMLVLLTACVAARVRFDRKLVPLTLLLAIWLAGAFFALIPVLDQKQTVQYVATSAYLVIAAIMFACLFCDDDLIRLLILRRAYIIAALIATAAGYVGFFHLLPGSDIFLANDRVSATFKDPNVYGPFLIFPLLLLLIDFMTRGLRLTGLTIMTFLIGGLFLSFSRGAWAHFAISAAVTVALLLAAATEPRMRTRILLFSRFPPCTTCSSSAPRRSSPMTSALADASGSRGSRSALSSKARTAWARSSFSASMERSSTTSICMRSWSMAGSAAPPIWPW